MNLLPDSIIRCVISAKYSCVIDWFFSPALLGGDSFMHVSGIFNHIRRSTHWFVAEPSEKCHSLWNIFTQRVKVHTEGNIICYSVVKWLCFTVSLKIFLTASHITLMYLFFITFLPLFIWEFAQNHLHFPSNALWFSIWSANIYHHNLCDLKGI